MACNRYSHIIYFAIICLSHSLATADIIKIVSPSEFEDRDANGYIPNLGPGAGFRGQESYLASEFQELPEGGAWLIAIAERADASERRPATDRLDQVRIAVGVTPHDNLSRVFSENLGPNPQTVIDGPYELQYDVTDDKPNPFSAIWRFDSPFLYTPTAGNLVVDYIVPSAGGGGPNLDAQRGVGRTAANSGGPGALMASNTYQNTLVSQFTFVPVGDVNYDGTLSVEDINELTPGRFDLNDDGDVNELDRTFWVHDIVNTWFGDANLDGEFNSADLTAVFQAGRFEVDMDAGWLEGDWTGDQRFGSSDLIAAFQDGGYERGPRAAFNAVPEPASFLALPTGLIITSFLRRSLKSTSYCYRNSSCLRKLSA